MQIVSLGDNLHEMSMPIIWGKLFQNVIWIFVPNMLSVKLFFGHMQFLYQFLYIYFKETGYLNKFSKFISATKIIYIMQQFKKKRYQIIVKKKFYMNPQLCP